MTAILDPNSGLCNPPLGLAKKYSFAMTGKKAPKVDGNARLPNNSDQPATPKLFSYRPEIGFDKTRIWVQYSVINTTTSGERDDRQEDSND